LDPDSLGAFLVRGLLECHPLAGIGIPDTRSRQCGSRKKNVRADFGGKPGKWAYSESPLIDGEVLVVTPGGAEATLVALNKKTGAAIWKSAVPGGDSRLRFSGQPVRLRRLSPRENGEIAILGSLTESARLPIRSIRPLPLRHLQSIHCLHLGAEQALRLVFVT
jgi:hypothetical protein